MPDKGHPNSNLFDAYFIDEFGVVNDASNTPASDSGRVGLHKNIFTITAVTGSHITETMRSGMTSIKNMADPENNAVLKAKTNIVANPIETSRASHNFSFYFSDSAIAYSNELKAAAAAWNPNKPLKITLFFGVGTELNRSGIRTFFKGNTHLTAIILVPGIEPGFINNNKGRWGISLTDSEIKSILNNFFGIPVAYEVVILAAYSTGMNGVNQTILNDIINLNKIKRVLIYDCLYVTSSGNTADTFRKIKNINSNVEIIIYWSTVSKESNSLDENLSRLLVFDKAKPVITVSDNLIQVAGQKWYRALICTRIIQAGVKDGLVTLSANEQAAFNAIEPLLPARGTVISNEAMFKKIYGAVPTGFTTGEDWYKTHKNIIDQFYQFIDKKEKMHPGLMPQVYKNKVMGWHGTGSETHDLLLPEFAWEYLPFK